MRQPIRKSLLYLAVIQAIGAGACLPVTVLADADTTQPSAAAAFTQSRDLQRELIELKNAAAEAPEDAALRFKLGTAYLRLGDAASAEKELTQARRLGMDGYELLLALGEIWIAQGEFRRVFTDDALLAAKGPDQIAALKTLQGQSLLVQGRTDEARDHFVEALAQVAGYGPALLAIAESELADGEVVATQQAMSRARLAKDLDPVELLRVEANLAFKLGRFDEAVAYYRQALKQRGGDPILRRGLAVSQLRQGQPEQANETLDSMLAVNPNDGDAIALKARAALQMQDYQTAAELAGAVVGFGADERRVGPLFTAGAASLLNGSPHQAREYLSRYLAQRPEDGNARRLLGQALLQADDAEEAYSVLKPLTDAAEGDARLLSEVALAAAAAGAAEDAVALLEQAVELEPDDATLKARLAAVKLTTTDRRAGLEQLEQIARDDEGHALLALEASINRLMHGELDAAIATAGDAQQLAPDATVPRLVQAIALLRAGQLDGAEAAFTDLLEQQPDHVAARTGMAEIHLRRGEPDRAVSAFEKLAEENPDDVTLRINIASAELQAGRRIQAQERLEAIIADHRDSTAARAALATLYVQDALPDQAIEVLQDTRDREDPAVIIATAQAHLIADRPADAVALLEPLVAAQPGSAQARLALAKAYERNGDGAGAERMLEAALEITPDSRSARYAMLRLRLIQPRIEGDALARLEDETLRFMTEQPSDPRSQVLRSLVLFRTDGQRALALDALRRLQQAYPSGDLTALAANLHLVDARYEDAVALLETYVSAHEQDRYARLRLARAQIAAGLYDAAADNLVLGIEQGARRRGLALTTAWTLAAAGRYDDARPYLAQATKEDASGPMMSHTRGLLRLGDGDPRGAVSALQEALTESGDRPGARLRLDLAAALIEVGELGEARRLLQALQEQQLSGADRVAKAALDARLR